MDARGGYGSGIVPWWIAGLVLLGMFLLIISTVIHLVWAIFMALHAAFAA